MATAGGRRRLVLLILTAAVIVAVAAGAVVVGRNEQTRSASALCQRLSDAASLDDAIVTLDPTTLGPQIAALERALDAAPDDIRPQLAELTEFVREIGDEVRAANTDKKQVLADALAARQDRIDAITADGQALELWSITNCSTPLRGTSSSSSSTNTTARPTTSSTSTTLAPTSLAPSSTRVTTTTR